MKTYNEFINEKIDVYYDDDYSTWAAYDEINYGVKQGYEPVAAFSTKAAKLNDFVLFELNDFDKKETSDVKLKSGQKIYRYTSNGTIINKSMPLIAVDVKKAMAYYLTEESSSGEEDITEFERKGVKMTWLRLIKKHF